MILYTGVATVTVLLAFLVDNKTPVKQYGFSRQQVLNMLSLLSVFLILFAVSALRVNVGNDYAKYVEFFHLNRCRLDTDSAVVPTEAGFNILCIAIYLLSGRTENYLLMFAVFAFATIFFFMKAIYEQADSFGMSFLMFMCLGYYFQSFSTVRYYFALALAVYAIPFVLRREWAKFILIAIFGAFFHKSMLVIIPLYFLAQWAFKKWQIAIAAVFCGSLVVFKDFYLALFLKLYPTYEETEYLSAGTSFINILRCGVILVFSLIMYKRLIAGDRKMSFYFYCNLGALAVYCCCFYIPAISRLGYYLNITHIFFLPALIEGVSNEKLKKLLKAGMILALILYFAVFILMKAESNGLRILPYQTFLFHDMVDILSDVT